MTIKEMPDIEIKSIGMILWNVRALVEFAKAMTDVGQWTPVFGSEIEKMNSRRVGRPFLCCDPMMA